LSVDGGEPRETRLEQNQREQRAGRSLRDMEVRYSRLTSSAAIPRPAVLRRPRSRARRPRRLGPRGSAKVSRIHSYSHSPTHGSSHSCIHNSRPLLSLSVCTHLRLACRVDTPEPSLERSVHQVCGPFLLPACQRAVQAVLTRRCRIQSWGSMACRSLSWMVWMCWPDGRGLRFYGL
jgi:hypothetical protein